MSHFKCTVLFLMTAVIVGSWGALAAAEEASAEGDAEAAAPEAEAAEAEAAEAAEAEPAEAEPAEAEPEAEPASDRPQASAAAVRLGRIELVLIQNEDPESALEFGQELIEEDGDSARIRLLFGACKMRLNQGAQAAEHFSQAVEQAGRDDPSMHLRALYNVARSLQAAGQFSQAAEAYDRYVAYARSHSDLPSFVAYAEQLATTLRARAAGASSSR